MTTIADALDAFRRLSDVAAGTLGGMSLRYRRRAPLYLGDLPDPWASTLRASIEARDAGTVTDDTPQYLIFSGGTVVAWCTVTAAVVTPDMPLSRTQAKHRRMAVEALGDLARHVLVELADARDARTGFDNRTTMAQPGAVRVAPASDPTWSFSLVIDGDLAKAQAVIAGTLAARGGDPAGGAALVIDACGYGRYGREAHRLPLEVLCAMHQIADTHTVPLAAVGNWPAQHDGTTADAPANDIEDVFAAEFLGVFASRTAYAEHYMRQHGWTDALAAAGINTRFINLDELRRHLFDDEVTDVDTDDGTGSIVVLRRSTARP